jgi:hypothetical protein
MGGFGGGQMGGFSGGHAGGFGGSHMGSVSGGHMVGMGRDHYGYGRHRFGGYYDYGTSCPYYTSYNWPYTCTY